MLFSQRYGYRPVKDVVQRESMDEDLRVGLWNVLDMLVWSRESGYWMSGRPTLTRLTMLVWHSYFKEPLNTIPDNWPGVVKILRTYHFECPWNEAYDFVEFIAIS